ncbi:F-box domain-containing protein [Mycena venus]|uniref:F-box domain-containing protein n=1 Tax=Mycena venus TaxID=2733690 RepID=A0A8H7DBT6_9AGAR|nr:F-box domain-containing protein [Mycena venus]
MSLPQPPAIHTLPTELVREIVRASCDASAELTLPFPTAKPPAISVSQFCSKWRVVAHNECSLWQDFRVDLPDELDGGRYEALMNFIANGALGNRTCLVLRQGAYRPPHLNPVLPILVTHAQCMRSLSLNIPGQTVEQIFSTSVLPLNHLETLSIAIRVTSQNDVSFLESPEDYVSTVFTATPSLTRVTIGYDELMPITLEAFPLGAWGLPWGQLTEFNAPNIWIDVIQFFNIVDDCPNLVSCVLTLDAEGADDPEDDNARVTLVHLRKFHVTFLELYGWVWSNLILPSLVDLKIATYRDTMEWEDDVFEEFMVRSGCSLTHLALYFGFLDAIDAMLRIFDAAPDLQELTLRWTRLPGSDDEEWDVAPLMDYLTYQPHTVIKLPNLVKVLVDATPESVRMLVSRCQAPASTLAEVVLYAEQPSSCEALFAAEIGTLRAAGVQVVWERMVFLDQLEEIYDPNYSDGARTPRSSKESESDEGEYHLNGMPEESASQS